jgi:alcohol dehydrogenase
LGRDGAGEVVAIGEEVEKFKVGDEVAGVFGSNGAYAEYVLCTESELCIKPPDLPMEVAAAIPLTSETVYQMFQFDEDCKKSFEENKRDDLPNKRILIAGASGGTGSLAVLLAKHFFGARVYAICGTDNVDYVKNLGADHVIDYKKEKLQDAIPDIEKKNYSAGEEGPFIDLTLDCVGGMEHDAFEVMGPNGTFVTIAPPSVVEEKGLTLGSMIMMIGGVSLNKLKNLTGLGPKYYPYLMHSDGNQLQQICSWLVQQKLVDKIEISSKYPLKDVAKAHKESETEKTRGKILIEI